MNEPPQWNAPQILSGRAKITQAVQSPLGFFVLALLIVEVFLLGAGIWFDLEAKWKIAAIATGVFLFVVVFFTVVYLVVRCPRNLVFSEDSHVQFAAMKMYGTEKRNLSIKEMDTLTPERQPADISQANQQPMLIDAKKED